MCEMRMSPCSPYCSAATAPCFTSSEYTCKSFRKRSTREVTRGSEEGLWGTRSCWIHSMVAIHTPELCGGFAHLGIGLKAPLQVFNVGVLFFSQSEVGEERF